MPRTTTISRALAGLISHQDGVVTTAQLASHGVTPDAVQHRVGRREWQRVLPGVVLTVAGTPTRRQLVLAAWLWAGPGAAIDGASACRWYGLDVPWVPADAVHVVLPFGAGLRSRSFVVVRRTTTDIVVGDRTAVPYVDRATACIVAARSAMRERSAIGLLSRALQTGLVGLGELRDARDSLGDKWCHNVDRALVGVGVGVRSPAERDMRALMLTSRVLPEARWNQWLDLGDGDPPVCVDSLIEEARLVNEVEGRRYHAWANQFEDMHARHERLTAAGLVVLHPTPRRIRFEAGALLARLEQSYLGNRGRGLPPGVRLIDPPQLRAA